MWRSSSIRTLSATPMVFFDAEQEGGLQRLEEDLFVDPFSVAICPIT